LRTAYDFPIEHEIQNSLKNPGLRSLFVVGTSYRSRKRAGGASGARLATNLSKKCFSPKNIF